MSRVINLVGQKFSRLTVIEKADYTGGFRSGCIHADVAADAANLGFEYGKVVPRKDPCQGFTAGKVHLSIFADHCSIRSEEDSAIEDRIFVSL